MSSGDIKKDQSLVGDRVAVQGSDTVDSRATGKTMEEKSRRIFKAHESFIVAEAIGANKESAVEDMISKGLVRSSEGFAFEKNRKKRVIECKNCGNKDIRRFTLSKHHGSLVCMKCGTIQSESRCEDSASANTRRDDNDNITSQYGQAANVLYSKTRNYMSEIKFTKGNRMSGHLNRVQREVSMGVSNQGKVVRGTRDGYKDAQKRKYFERMSAIMGKVSIEEDNRQIVLSKAKAYFAGHRNQKQSMQKPETVMAACLVKALREVEENVSESVSFKCVSTWEWRDCESSELQSAVKRRRVSEDRPLKRRKKLVWKRIDRESALALERAWNTRKEGETRTCQINLEGVSYTAELAESSPSGMQKIVPDTANETSATQPIEADVAKVGTADCVRSDLRHFRVRIESANLTSFKSHWRNLRCKLILRGKNQSERVLTFIDRSGVGDVDKSKGSHVVKWSERFLFRIPVGCQPTGLRIQLFSQGSGRKGGTSMKKSKHIHGHCDVELEEKTGRIKPNKSIPVYVDDDAKTKTIGTLSVHPWQSAIRRWRGCHQLFPSLNHLNRHICPVRQTKKKRGAGDRPRKKMKRMLRAGKRRRG